MTAAIDSDVPGMESSDAPAPRRFSSRRLVGWAAAVLLVTTVSTVGVAPLFDPDEGFYPATAAESVDAGSAWDPQFNGEPRWDKPILTYALIQGSFKVFGRTVSASRLPSVLEGVLLVLIVGFAVNRMAGAQAAGLAALVLGTTTGVQIFSRVAHPEIGLVLMITAAELCALLWMTSDQHKEKRWLAVIGGVALGLGLLFKGPVAVVLPVLAVVATSALLWGVRLPSAQAVGHTVLAAAVTLIVALPWYVAMTWRHGLEFFQEAVWQQNVGRYMGESFVHRSPPWFFVLPTLIAMFPWTAFVPGALTRISRASRQPADVLRLFMAAAAVTSFVFYSASGSKLPHYALVFVPPLAVLVALRLNEVRAPKEISKSTWGTVVTMTVLALALAVLPLLVNRAFSARRILSGLSRDSDVMWLFAQASWPPALVLAAAAIGVMVFRTTVWRTLVVAGAVLPTVMILAAGPLLAHAFPQDHLGAMLRGSDLPVWVIGARSPSLTFYIGRPVTRFSEGDSEHRPLPAAEGWIVADTNWLARRAKLPDDASRLEIIESFGGMTLARWHGGQKVAVQAIRPAS